MAEGVFPRINSAMLNSGQYTESIVSLVGKTVSFDGSTMQFECADGGKVQVQMQPEWNEFQPGQAMEIMGSANEDRTVQVRFFQLSACMMYSAALLFPFYVCVHWVMCHLRYATWLSLETDGLIKHMTFQRMIHLNPLVFYTFSLILPSLSICQHFICRDLGSDFDFSNYNELITKVMKNQKYAEIFHQQ